LLLNSIKHPTVIFLCRQGDQKIGKNWPKLWKK
jgi:hypothetical protein